MVNFMLRLLYPCEITPVPTEYVAGWVPGPAGTFWKNDKSLAHTGIWTLDRPTRSLVTILNMLLWLLGVCPKPLECIVTQEISIPLTHSLLARSEVTELHIQLLNVENALHALVSWPLQRRLPNVKTRSLLFWPSMGNIQHSFTKSESQD